MVDWLFARMQGEGRQLTELRFSPWIGELMRLARLVLSAFIVLGWLSSTSGLPLLLAQGSYSAPSFSDANLPTVNLAERFSLLDPLERPVAVYRREQALNPSLDAASVPTLGNPSGTTLKPGLPLDNQDQVGDSPLRVGYDGGFVIASQNTMKVGSAEDPYRLVINGWGQLRDTVFDSKGAGSDLNQLQLKRARLVFSGNAFTPEFRYYVQLDGRSNSGDAVRILDYYLTYDLGHHIWKIDRDTLGFKTGLYKMPFSLARQLSGKELQFADRSMSSMYFDVNRSLAWGLYGKLDALDTPINWEVALFNGLVTGGAETGSSGDLDNNNAVSARISCFPTGDWQSGQLADFTIHDSFASRLGAGCAFTTIDRSGQTEFNALRSVDSGASLATLLPTSVTSYDVALYSLDGSMKFLGVSATCEYYFRNVNGFRGVSLPNLFDHGFWLQTGIFLIPQKLELLSRWSRVQGSSGTLGAFDQSSEEIAGGLVYYFREQQAKLTVDATYLNGASIDSSTLDIAAGDIGWLYRTQLQFSF